jgi:thioredoxin 2
MTEKQKVSCPECGATNLYPLAAPGQTVRCGRCKPPLPVPGQVLEPSETQVITLMRTAALPVLIDFYSDTCAPCRMMHPVVEALARRRAGELTVVRVKTDGPGELAAAFRIRAVPTFVVVLKDVERGRISGAMNETDFSLWVASKT